MTAEAANLAHAVRMNIAACTMLVEAKFREEHSKHDPWSREHQRLVGASLRAMADVYSTHEDVIDALRRYEDALNRPMAAPR